MTFLVGVSDRSIADLQQDRIEFMRSKEEIAADLEAAEATIKSAQKAIVQAAASMQGATLGAGFPDIEKIPMNITLPDGRSITLGQLAEEIRGL